jgi:hypothetical protein
MQSNADADALIATLLHQALLMLTRNELRQAFSTTGVGEFTIISFLFARHAQPDRARTIVCHD